MFSVAEAQQRILAAFSPLEAEVIPLAAALGRILAEDAVAQDQLPLFDNSAMDGYALRAADTQGGDTRPACASAYRWRDSRRTRPRSCIAEQARRRASSPAAQYLVEQTP